MPDPIRLENGYGCYCPDCAGSWPQADKSIKVCSCPCHEEEDEDTTGRDGAEEWMHDDTCDCDECCGDEEDEEDGPTPEDAIGEDEAAKQEERRHTQPVVGCECRDCLTWRG